MPYPHNLFVDESFRPRVASLVGAGEREQKAMQDFLLAKLNDTIATDVRNALGFWERRKMAKLLSEDGVTYAQVHEFCYTHLKGYESMRNEAVNRLHESMRIIIR